jgi:hypothetical protein
MAPLTQPIDGGPEPGAVAYGGGSLWRDSLANVLRQRNAVTGLTILLFFVLIALFADQIAQHDPTRCSWGPRRARRSSLLLHSHAQLPDRSAGALVRDRRQRPGRVQPGRPWSARLASYRIPDRWLRDRDWDADRAIAGFAGGMTDNVLMRLMDILLAFPALLLAIAIVNVLGSGLLNTTRSSGGSESSCAATSRRRSTPRRAAGSIRAASCGPSWVGRSCVRARCRNSSSSVGRARRAITPARATSGATTEQPASPN